MNSAEKNKVDLINSINLLKSYLENFEDGNILYYLSMAVELRKLLCETKSSPLITRVIPTFKLYKLNSTKNFKNTPSLLKGLLHIMPGQFLVSEKGVQLFSLSFSKDKELMNIDEWVDQIFFTEKITIRELIKSVADKEAVHSDNEYNDTLIHCKTWTYYDSGCHVLGIYSIARFIYSLITTEYKKLLI